MRYRIVTIMAISMLIALGWSAGLLAADVDADVGTDGEIYRAQFTTAVEEREPVDEVTQLGTDHDRIMFFMEVRDMGNQTLTHRYMHDGEVQSEVDLHIGGPRWRTWSSKRLLPEWEGNWTVEVVDAEGDVHGSWSFDYADEHAIDYMEERTTEEEPEAEPESDYD